MSAYIQFFVKGKDCFYPIATYTRGSRVYAYFNRHAPWEKVALLSREILEEIIEEISVDVDKNLDDIVKKQNIIEVISKFQDPIEEKYELIENVNEDIRRLWEEIDELNRAKEFSFFLVDIIAEGEGSRFFKDPPISQDYLYVGIECGSFPTFEDIERG